MNPKNVLLSLLLAASGGVACTNGHGEIDVTSAASLSFPAATASPGAAARSSEADLSWDFHEDLGSAEQAGALTLGISSDSLGGADLAGVSHVLVTIETADGILPARPLVDVDIVGGTTAELPHVLSDSDLLGYFVEGPVVVRFTISGNLPERPIALTHSLVAHVDVAVSTSVEKL